MYDFDTVYPRDNRASEKWDLAARAGCPKGVVPFSVADMEFRTAPEIVEEVQQEAEFGLWGYTYADKAFRQDAADWMSRRNGWDAKAEWAVATWGVVPAIYAAVRAFTGPGDRVLVQPPVYYPFFSAVEENGRVLLENPLVHTYEGWRMDLDDLRCKARLAKLMILCSPHNPVGRVWTREELAAVLEICYENNVLVFADEIHCDIVLQGGFTPTAGIGEKYLANLLVGTAASKTFSLAGLNCASIFIPEAGLRRRYRKQLQVDGLHFNGNFGIVATRAAYRKGEPWLEQAKEYIRDNAALLHGFLERELPGVKMADLQGTYLAWIDFSSWGLTDGELAAFLEREACLYLSHGVNFGTGGSGFMRMNIACPRQVLQEALDRLLAATQKRGLPTGK